MLIVAITSSWADQTYYLQTPGESTPALTGDFYTTATLSQDVTCSYDNVSYSKAIKLGGGVTSASGNNYPDRMIRYDCKTTQTEFTFVVYNPKTSAYNYYISSVKESAIGSGNTVSDFTSYSASATGVNYNSTANSVTCTSATRASVYFTVGNANLYVVQIIATEKGENLLTPGTAGYAVNFNKGRIVARSGAATTLDNYLEIHQNQNYAAGSTTYAKMQTKGTNYIKFTTTEATKLSVSVSSSSTYYISSTKNASESPAPKAYTATATDVEIAAGTWYIVPNGSNVNITGLSFATAAPAQTYNVTYKANGSGEADVEHTVAKVEANMFTWDGHTFTGWNTKADGTGDAYAVNASLTDDITLFAQWLADSDATFSNGQYVIGGSALDLSTLFASSSDGDVTYTVKDAGDTGAAIAIDGTSFTATAPGTATVTATQAATATYAGASLDATITVGKTTGANTIEWELSPIGSNKATLTSTQTSTSLYLKNLTTINHSLVGLASSPSSASNRTAKVNRLAGKDDSKYVYVTFDVEDGYTFVPSKVTIKVANVNNVTTFDAELVGENGESVGETGKTFSSTDGTVETWEITPTVEKSLTGTVTLKIYAYAETDGAFRFGTPIKIAGAVLPEPKEITLSETDGKTKGFATFCGAQNFTVSGASAYKASINSNKIVLTPLGNEETVISAEAGIIIAGDKGATATVTYTTDDATAEMSGNSLKGTTARVATSTLKNSTTDKVVGFFKSSSAFKSYTGENFPANLAYFLLTAENAVESFDIVFDGETAINSIDANDNANSVAPVKVIKNGKLYIGNYNVAGQLVK